ncbi:MAG TPA: chromosome segregation protein SMC [Armatimonadota bacterium]|nr:chromosome segregation protein SMC [Armatimonadota bacterium]
MHLKRLELFGFKTFADRTELEFLPGITAVVGPNGSGKSNIADAIQWVLGEQSMRSLRSLSSQDVIFSGTHRRKPLGFAEASLTFDNSDRSLPLDFEEVTVTRRLFRSGESEYAINKVPCRLKDIVELFLDTGVGCDAYAIIGQGEIDAVLSIKSEDRRALLEEAAGIKKYRVRKREATRKLEATQANLARVSDIISEIEGQLPPLREQAEIARDYRDLRDQAQSLERALLLTEHQRALQQVVQFQATHKTAADHVDALQAELARLESEAEAAKLAVTQADTVLDEARSAYSAAAQQVERGRGELAVSGERLTALETAEKNDDERLAELDQAMARCRQQQAEIATRIAAAEEAEKEAGEALNRCQKQLSEVNGRIATVSRTVEDHRRQAVDRARALTNAQADLRAAQRRVHDIKASAERTAQRLEVLKARGETQDAREEKLRAKVAEAEARCETLSAEIKRAELQRATLQREAHLRGQRIADLRNEITARSARLRVLRELEDKFEGYREGARAVLQAQKKGRLNGHFLPVADLVDVDPEYESAIQAALGGGMDALLADSLADAREAVRYLRQEGGGRATFIIRGAQLGLPRADDPEELIRRCTVNLVRCKENYRPLVQALLGDTVLADHLDEAQHLLSLDHARYRAVTRDGDLLSARGTLTGGRAQGGAGSLLARRREMTTLQQEVSHLEAELAGATKQNDNQATILRTAETEVRRHRESSAQAATALAAAKKDLDYAGQERRRLGEEYRKLEQSIEHSHTDVEKAIANENRLQQRVAELQAQDTGADADVEKAREQLTELNRERDQAAEAVSEQKIAAARARQQAESLRENAARAAQQETEIGKSSRRAEMMRDTPGSGMEMP